jgi:SRSO17 transposase
VPERRAVYQLRRLMTWLEAFKVCFGHRAQVLALRRYVQGLLSDSARKSMEAMLARVTEPGSYQAFQHFITDAPWSADAVWRRLRAVIPESEVSSRVRDLRRACEQVLDVSVSPP